MMNQLSLDAIKHSVNSKEGWQVVAEACNGNQVIASLIDQQLDVLFLDINMPGMNGIEVAEKIKHATHAPLVVFVTAYEKYAIPAFKVHAFGYLMKPFDEEEFDGLIKQLEKRLCSDKGVKTQQVTNPNAQWLRVKQKGKVYIIPVNNIIKSVSARNYMQLYTTDGEYTLRSSVSEFIELVNGHDFVRIHRSVVLNLNYVKLVQSGPNGWSLQLKNGSQVPISHSYLEEVTERLQLPID